MTDSDSAPFWLVAAPDPGAAAEVSLPSTTELYARHGSFVWRVLARLGVSEADREDLLQEVFVVAHRMRDRYQRRGQVTSWLYGIALRVASGHRRRVRVRREVSSENTPPTVDPRTPESATSERQRAALLEQLLSQLPSKKRVVFVMFELEGLSCVAISAELGIPVGTVYSRLHEAREAFTRAYGEVERLSLGGTGS